MITRRSVLAATGGVAGLAAAQAAGAQTPTVSTQGRNGTMQIARVGSQARTHHTPRQKRSSGKSAI